LDSSVVISVGQNHGENALEVRGDGWAELRNQVQS